MSNGEEGFTGGCLCGAVRYAVRGRPTWIAHCHCRSCRRQTGSAVAPFVGISRAQLTWLGETPRSHQSSPGVTRSFCPHCGTPIAYETEQRPEDVDLHLGTLDEPERFPPRFHVHDAERIAWLHIEDGLPRYAGSSDGGGQPA
ncbi:MAG: GFA family protein [Kiloniellales bacterium]